MLLQLQTSQLFLSCQLTIQGHRLALALYGGAVGAAAELAVPSPAPRLDSKKFPLALDDNFIVPIVSCIVIQSTVDHLVDTGGLFA